MRLKLVIGAAAALIVLGLSSVVFGHGDVTPQAVDTEGLESLPEEIAAENPYRLAGGEQYELAQKIGASGYNLLSQEAMWAIRSYIEVQPK